MWKELKLEECGFCGYYKEGTINADKAIICMSGSDGNKDLAISIADVFIEEGYSVLVLGFFKWEGLSKEACNIPVEYVENAVKWLLQEQNGKIKKVGIRGSSMGAQYALLCASLIPEISCVITAAPFDHVMEYVTDRFKRGGHSTYSYQGKEIAYSPSVLLDKSFPLLLWQCITDKQYGLKRMFRFYYDKNPITDDSRIKVENMKADVLLMASVVDDCWPALETANRIEGILKQNQYPYRVKKVIYEKGSHAIGSSLRNEEARKKILKMLPQEKKYPKECEEARVDSVRQIAEFLRGWK